ncbi:hypothetical protein DPMN_045056 [Dreissena polymorpha]|uniref:Uncharacterized protein n=1 Tax=Dreissena polymorpha TaxID=45954 RepID=A0A9D4D709_DREPO|nr:hypothetical protein DPMN_045056 [Dreissena polymorpha]
MNVLKVMCICISAIGLMYSNEIAEEEQTIGTDTHELQETVLNLMRVHGKTICPDSNICLTNRTSQARAHQFSQAKSCCEGMSAPVFIGVALESGD